MNSSRITFTLNEVVYVLNAAADRLLRAHFSITYSQFLFLVTLQALGESTASRLAETLGVSRAAVSQRLSWFEQRELISVTKVVGNDKTLSLRLTDQGGSLVSSSADFLEREFRVLFDGLESVDLNQLNESLLQIKSQLIRNQEARVAA